MTIFLLRVGALLALLSSACGGASAGKVAAGFTCDQTVAGVHTCAAYSYAGTAPSTGQLDEAKGGCTQAGGMLVDACPGDAVGTCSYSTSEGSVTASVMMSYYATDASIAMTACAALPGGQWTAGAGSSCAMGLTMCSDGCVDLMTDANDCGACGVVVQGPASCVAGAPSCGGGRSYCGGACVDLMTDPMNCGKCGYVLGSGATCQGGQVSCLSSTLTPCNGACVDLMTDSTNCGSCGNDIFQPTDPLNSPACENGQPTCASSLPTLCTPGTPGSKPYCVDLTSDSGNCGACGANVLPDYCIASMRFVASCMQSMGSAQCTTTEDTATCGQICAANGETCPLGSLSYANYHCDDGTLSDVDVGCTEVPPATKMSGSATCTYLSLDCFCNP